MTEEGKRHIRLMEKWTGPYSINSSESAAWKEGYKQCKLDIMTEIDEDLDLRIETCHELLQRDKHNYAAEIVLLECEAFKKKIRDKSLFPWTPLTENTNE